MARLMCSGCQVGRDAVGTSQVGAGGARQGALMAGAQQAQHACLQRTLQAALLYEVVFTLQE